MLKFFKNKQTQFHKWYDKLEEPYRLLSLILVVSAILIAGTNISYYFNLLLGVLLLSRMNFFHSLKLTKEA